MKAQLYGISFSVLSFLSLIFISKKPKNMDPDLTVVAGS